MLWTSIYFIILCVNINLWIYIAKYKKPFKNKDYEFLLLIFNIILAGGTLALNLTSFIEILSLVGIFFPSLSIVTIVISYTILLCGALLLSIFSIVEQMESS